MSSFVFNKFKSDLMRGVHDLSAANNTYYVALVVSATAFSAVGVSALADITDPWTTLSATWDIAGISGTGYNKTGYTSGVGLGLSGCSVSAINPSDFGKWTADNITWQNSTIDCDGCVIYKNDGLMVCAIDFGTRKSSSNGDFTIQWSTNGILDLS